MNRRPHEVRQRISEGVKRALAVPGVLERRTEALKRAFADPAVRQRRIEGLKRALAKPKTRQRKSQACKRTWADPEVRQRRSAAIKRSLAKAEVRQRMSAAIKCALAKPEVRQRKSAAGERTWADPKVRQRRIEGMQCASKVPEARQRRIERNKAWWTTERRGAMGNRSAKMWADRKAALEANQRPDDWEKKPPLWQIVLEIIVCHDGYVSNEELGEIMDDERIKCDYGHSWRAALSSDTASNSKVAIERIRRIRRWIDRHGLVGPSR